VKISTTFQSNLQPANVFFIHASSTGWYLELPVIVSFLVKSCLVNVSKYFIQVKSLGFVFAHITLALQQPKICSIVLSSSVASLIICRDLSGSPTDL